MDYYVHIYVCLLMCEQKLKQKLTCLQEGLVQDGQHENLHLKVQLKSQLVFLTSCLDGYFISHLINMQCVACFLQVLSLERAPCGTRVTNAGLFVSAPT